MTRVRGSKVCAGRRTGGQESTRPPVSPETSLFHHFTDTYSIQRVDGRPFRTAHL